MPGEFSSGARLEIRITPADVGKRVSVRQLVEIADGHPTFTDTVGVLVSWDAGVVCVTRRNGETVRMAEASVVAGKVVPPAPRRRVREVPDVTAEELDTVAARAWPATETDRLGEWTLRASGGFTRRANSVLVTGDPGVPLDDALAGVVAWYARRGLTPWIQLPDSSPYGAELAARGWRRAADSLVRTAPLAPLTRLPEPVPSSHAEDSRAPGPRAGGFRAEGSSPEGFRAEGSSPEGSRAEGSPEGRVTLSRTPDAAWLAAYHRTGDLADAALKVVTGGPSVWFATMPGAIGRAVVDGPWALFGAVEVVPERRRRGLGTAIMRALARQAAAEGATAAYLQVEADNAAARAMYDRMGFTDHHGYHYRRPAA